MDVPFPPSPSDVLEYAAGGSDGLTAMIDDLDVCDDALFQYGEYRVPTTNSKNPVDLTGGHANSRHISISQSVAEKRIERTRERNRRAQAKYRQKMKDQCVSLERHIQELQVRLGSSHCKRATLQHANDENSVRVSAASDALSAMATQAVGHPPQAASSHSQSPSLTTPSLPNPAGPLLVHQNEASSFHNAVVGKSVQRGLSTDPQAPPAPIHSFKHCAGISYELLYRAATSMSPLSNFTRQSSRRIIDEFKQKTAESLGCSQSQIPELQRPLPIPPPFVTSSHLHLLSASPSDQGSSEEGNGQEQQHSTKRVRRAGLPHDAPTGHESVFQEPPSAATLTRDANPAWTSADCASNSDSGSASTRLPGPSGSVRCGVGGSACTHTAVIAALRAVIEPYVGTMPQRTLRQLLDATARQGRVILDELPQTLARAQGVADTGSGADGGAADGAADVYHTGAIEAIRSVMMCAVNAADSLLEQLPVMEAQSSDRPPPSRAALRDRSAAVMVSLGLGLMLTFRDAPRIIRRLAVKAVIPLLCLYEVENMQVVLYRGLHASAEQRDKMAAYWSAWERRKRELDSAMDDAQDALVNIPGRADLPIQLLTHISAVGGGACRHVQVSLRQPRAGEDVGCWTGGEAQLLGSCPEATVAAREALDKLWAVHIADSELYADTLDLQLQPQLLLGLEQLARVYAGHVTHETAPVDFMALCQLAKTQQHRDAMFKRRPV